MRMVQKHGIRMVYGKIRFEINVFGVIMSKTRSILLLEIRNEEGELHSEDDIPALTKSNGSHYWYNNGLLHRDNDKPAVKCCFNGTKVWYNNGEIHRDGDKPAFITYDGTKIWYKNGKIHRDGDKYAYINSDGYQAWYKNGKTHRDGDKPAVIYANGTIQFWVDGSFINEENCYIMNLNKV